MCESYLIPKPPGICIFVIFPGEGWKVTGSSALILHSIAWPKKLIDSWSNLISIPSAILSWALTISKPVIISVTGCSTWILVFISMK